MTEREIFFEALEMATPEACAAYLQGACGRDVVLRCKVDELLKEHFSNDRLLAGPALDGERPGIAEFPVEEAPAQMIGRYKLLEKLGEGGFGEVWMAEQREPVKRRVAFKIIKLGMDSRQIVARFEAERQALAMMDHPNIAKIFDAGTTENPLTPTLSQIGHIGGAGARRVGEDDSRGIGVGRPYFVMELVRGIKITEYCDQNQLPTQERLRLFILVCQAIQHAHQKGIIHRDIKPSNILVTLHDGVPVPKVIDFGIAKATQQELTDKTVFTQFQQFIGTPAYISPEQAEMSGLDIDTRADIYSLGVLLYELLVGQTPFDAKEMMQGGLDAMRQIIREKEPLRPSTRLNTLLGDARTTAGKRRQTDVGKLVHQLQGDLDWIAMKCLEKDRARRYETANGLASDLLRHLNDEPVTARPPSTAYRFQKLLRRNKVMAGAVMLVLTAILVGTVISIGQALRAGRELRRANIAKTQALAAEAKALASEEKAQTEKANAQATLHFLQDDVLNQASPSYQPDRDIKVRTLLDNIAERLNRDDVRSPLVVASIHQTLGSVYGELGDPAKAVLHYEHALEIQRRRLGEYDPDTLRSLHGLATACLSRGDMSKADALTRQGLEDSRRVLGEKSPLTLQFMNTRAYTILFTGAIPWTELEPLFLKALALNREVFGADELRTLRLASRLGLGYNLNWNAAKAEPIITDALERAYRVLGEKHPDTAGLTLMMGYIYSNLNQPEKAEPLALRNLEVRRSILGNEHFATLVSVLLLARVYVQQQKFDQAAPLTEQVVTLGRRLPIENSTVLPWKLSLLSGAYLDQGHVAEAATLGELALQALRRKPDANPRANPFTITQMGAIRLAQQKYAEAEALLVESSPLLEKHWPDAAYRFHVMSLFGASLSGQQKYAEAESPLLQGFQGLQQRQASIPAYLSPKRRIVESLERLIQLYDAWGKPSKATEWRQKLTEFEQAEVQRP
jgi:serine/threonine protein kinase